MLTVEEFVKKFIDEDYEVDLPRYCMVHDEEHIEHKLVIYVEVWKHGTQFFEVTRTRDNVGYWGDGESYPPTVAEVFPIEVKSIEYVERTKDAN